MQLDDSLLDSDYDGSEESDNIEYNSSSSWNAISSSDDPSENDEEDGSENDSDSNYDPSTGDGSESDDIDLELRDEFYETIQEDHDSEVNEEVENTGVQDSVENTGVQDAPMLSDQERLTQEPDACVIWSRNGVWCLHQCKKPNYNFRCRPSGRKSGNTTDVTETREQMFWRSRHSSG